MIKISFGKNCICCLCGERFDSRKYHVSYKKICICKSCESKLPRVKTFGSFEGTRNLEFVIAPFYYEEPYRNIFLKFKFFGDYGIGHIIGQLASEYFKECDELDMFDFITVVPISKERHNQRGYNQSQLLAEYVSHELGISIDNVLLRVDNRVPQSTLPGYEKRMNIVGAFDVRGNVKGKRILVYDDVYTTGATLDECAAVLKSHGAKSVGGIVSAIMKRREYSEAYTWIK